MRQKVKLDRSCAPLLGSEPVLDARGHKVGRMWRFGRWAWLTGSHTAVNESTCVCGKVDCDKGCVCDCEGECEREGS
jgi:hypothetical protein